MEKLAKLLSLCKCSVNLTVNQHRDYYQTVEDYIAERADKEDIEVEVYKIMVEKNTIIELQFYPDTPIGFHVGYHYDLDKCLDEALECLEERVKTQKVLDYNS